MEGVKHIIECHCVLAQYKNSQEPIYHKFIVFSIIDDSNTVVPKYAQCNNCGVVHKVFDLCKSEILAGRDEITTTITKEDISPSLPSQIIEVLDSYTADVHLYEEASFILENKKWGCSMILTKEVLEDEITGKRLVFVSKNKYKIENFIQSIYFEQKN